MSTQARQTFADRSQYFLGGSGPGGDATSPLTRTRDAAAYERMRAEKPLTPPNRRAAREHGQVEPDAVKTAVVEADV